MGIGLILNETNINERQKQATVEWTKPRLLDKSIPIDKSWYSGQLYNVGLYYISRKFGSNETLLYIGQTSDSYYNRFVAHQENWLYQVRGRIYIRLGYIIRPSPKDAGEQKQLIKDIEGALIYEIQPPYNTDGKNSYAPRHLYVISNTRYKGELTEIIPMKNHIIQK